MKDEIYLFTKKTKFILQKDIMHFTCFACFFITANIGMLFPH